MYGLFPRPDHPGQINQAFMAAPPATHLEQFAAACNRIGDPGRRLGRAADELPHAPFLAGEPMRRAIGFLDLGRQIAVRLFGYLRSISTNKAVCELAQKVVSILILGCQLRIGFGVPSPTPWIRSPLTTTAC
jgi:hypothetical protein